MNIHAVKIRSNESLGHYAYQEGRIHRKCNNNMGISCTAHFHIVKMHLIKSTPEEKKINQIKSS